MSSLTSPPVRSSSSPSPSSPTLSHHRTPSMEESLASALRTLTQGESFMKYPFSRRGGPSARWIQLDAEDQSLIWFDRRKRSRGASLSSPAPLIIPGESPTAAQAAQSVALPSSLQLPPAREKSDRSIRLKDITEIHCGRLTRTFVEAQPQHPDNVCFSVTAGERTLDLAAANQSQRDLWAASLARVLKHQGISCKLNVNVQTHVSPTHDLALQAQQSITLASDPTNLSGIVGLAHSDLPEDDARSKASASGTIKMLEALILEKEKEILELRNQGSNAPAARRNSLQQSSPDLLELESRLKRSDELLQREKSTCQQESKSRQEAQMQLASALNEIAQLKANSNGHEKLIELARIEGKREGVASVQSDLAKSKAENTQLQSLLASERSMIKTIEDDLHFQESENAKQRATISELKQEVELLRNSEPAMRQAQVNQGAFTQIQSRCAQLEKELETEKETARTLEEDLSESETALTKSKKEIGSLQNQLDALNKEVTEMDQELHELQAQLNERTNELEEMRKNPQTTPTTATAAPTTTPNTVVQSLDDAPVSSSSNESLTDQIVTLRTQLLAAEDAQKELKHQLAQFETKEKKAAGERKKNADALKAALAVQATAESTAASATKRIDVLTKQVASLESSLSIAQNDLASARSAHSQALKALEEKMHTSEKALFEDLAKSTEQKIEKLRVEHAQEVETIREETTIELAASHSREVETLNKRIATLEVELKETLSRLEASSSTITAAAASAPSDDFTPADRARLEKQVQSTSTILSAQIQENAELETQLSEAHEREQALAGEISRLETAHMELLAENRALQSQLAQSLSHSQDLALQLSTSQEAIRVLETTADATVQHDLVVAEEREEERNRWQAIEAKHAEQIVTLEKRITDLDAELKASATRLEAANATIAAPSVHPSLNKSDSNERTPPASTPHSRKNSLTNGVSHLRAPSINILDKILNTAPSNEDTDHAASSTAPSASDATLATPPKVRSGLRPPTPVRFAPKP